MMNIPTSLGKYEILRRLDEGGMGTVYLAMDKKLHRHVAIKTIKREQLDSPEISSEYARRFELEAKAIAKLNHPHIVTVFDSGEEGEIAYLVMEFVEGQNLKYYFDRKTEFSLNEILRLMSGLLEALAHAHSKGVWHRDIKPANVMIDTEGQVKLTDFGVSRITDGQEKTRTTTQVGTLYYMSPEQVQNKGVSQRSDIFAAGVVLYQFLCGQRPFSGSDFEISNQIVYQDAKPVSSLNPTLPPLLDSVLAKAMAKDPQQRYADALQFLGDLKAALGNRQEPSFDADATRHFYAAQGSMIALDPQPLSQTGSKPQTHTAAPSEHAEIEFWRSIKDGSDADEFALYLSRFPNGTYAALARKRIAKLGEHSSHSHAQSGTQQRIEPSFVDFGTAPNQAPAYPAPAPASSKRPWLWLLLLLVPLIAGGFWWASQQNTQPAPPAGPSKPIAAASPAVSVAPPAASAASSPSPSPASVASVATPTPDPVSMANAEEAAAKAAAQTKARAEQMRLEKLAAAEAAKKLAQETQNKKEEAAKLAAQQAIAQQSGNSNYCVAQEDLEDSDCEKLKAKATRWINRWKSAEGMAKGMDKFRHPTLQECQCQDSKCSVRVLYERPCN